MRTLSFGLRWILILLLGLCSVQIFAQGTEEEFRDGIWVWGQSVRELGPDGAAIIAEQLQEFGFKDIFLLVKGNTGTLGYPSEVGLAGVGEDDRDILREMIDEAHARGIKVHAWYVVNGDRVYVDEYPEEGMCHFQYGPEQARVNPVSRKYRDYMKALVAEVLENYEVDGIHLDYIRYPHALLGFSEYEIANAEAEGVNMNKVNNLINRTFYEPADNTSIFRAYENRDPDVVKWVELRTGYITSFAQEIKEVIEACGRPVVYSAALMPEGATGGSSAYVHYGQCYRDAGKIYDLLVPMAYHGAYSKPPRWSATTAETARNIVRNVPVYAGIQAYELTGSREMASAVRFARESKADGMVLFRYGSFAFVSYKPEATEDSQMTVTLKVINSSGQPVDRIEVNFRGTGIVPEEVLEVQEDFSFSVDENTLVVEGSRILTGDTVEIVVAGRKEYEPNQEVLPSVELTFRKRLHTPVYIDNTAKITETAEEEDVLKAAVFSHPDAISDNSKNQALNILNNNGIQAKTIDSRAVRQGKLEDFDLLVLPGGRGGGIATALGIDGSAEVEQFVKNGGGVIGICAGAYFISRGYTVETGWLELIDGDILDVDNWDRGTGNVQVKVEEATHPVTAGFEDELTVYYFNGPLLEVEQPREPFFQRLLGIFKRKEAKEVEEDPLPYEILMTYTSAVQQTETARRMIDTPALVTADYEEGRCVWFSFHPELTSGLEKLLLQAAFWAGGE